MERAGNFSFRPLLVYMEYFIYSIFYITKCQVTPFFNKKILSHTNIVLTFLQTSQQINNILTIYKNPLQNCRGIRNNNKVYFYDTVMNQTS